MLAACFIPAPAQTTTSAAFTPLWLPQAQFAGYYAACELGIYKEHGLDIKIVPGGPANPSSESLTSGAADFGLLWLTAAIQLREKGAKIVNIAQMLPRSALMLVAKKSSGIREPKDLDGKKISLWGGDFLIPPLEFFSKYGIKPVPVRQGGSINLFLFDGVQAVSAMWYNEYHQILSSGLDPDELTTFFFPEYGLNFPEDGIYVTEAFFQRQPKLCAEFVAASVEGWRWAFGHPHEAVNIVSQYMKIANLRVNRAHQNWMLARMKDLMADGSAGEIKTGLSEKDYSFVAEALLRGGYIQSIPAYEEFCGAKSGH